MADLAAEAGRIYGLGDAGASTIRRAGLLHDIGRLGVSNAVWDKRDALTQADRAGPPAPYLSERMLAFSSALTPLGAIAVQHHERLDGSGYPRGLSGDAITPAGRILGAADAYHAMIELRPHRAARSPDEAASELRAEAVAGRLDGDAVDAVLGAAGHRVRQRRAWPAGLTTREVDVLRLVACGFSNKEIADRLVISRKTAGNHIEHIYAKIGPSNRARAGLFAMQQGLTTGMPPLKGRSHTPRPRKMRRRPHDRRHSRGYLRLEALERRRSSWAWTRAGHHLPGLRGGLALERSGWRGGPSLAWRSSTLAGSSPAQSKVVATRLPETTSATSERWPPNIRG